MSFGFNAAGDPEHAARQVRAVEPYGDPSQLDRARELVLAELADMPAGKDVVVEASGHHDEHGRQLTISVRTFWRIAKA